MALSQGHQVICCDRNRRGGLKRIWLGEQFIRKNSVPVVIDATGGNGPGGDTSGGEVLSFRTVGYNTVKRMGGWYEFQFERGTAGFNAVATRENGSTLVTVELEFYIPKLTMEINERLSELTESCGLYAIVESFADDCDLADPETYFFLLGWDKVFEEKAYLEFTSGEQSTGVALQDANGTLIKLNGVQSEYPREIMILLNYTNAAIPSAPNWVDMYQELPYAPGPGSITSAWQTD